MKIFGCLKDNMLVFNLAVGERGGSNVAVTTLPHTHLTNPLRTFESDKQ